MPSPTRNNVWLHREVLKLIVWFIFLTIAPKKKEDSFDLRETVIKHLLNSDSEQEIAQKVLIPRTSVHSIIAKYKKATCIRNMIGGGQKRKTPAPVDRVTQRTIKVDGRKSASSVKAEMETE